MLLSVHMILANAVKYDYPFREAVASVLPIADEVVLLCPPDDADGTRSACELLVREDARIRVLLDDWWRPAEGQDCLSTATNRCIEACQGEYHLALQADEVIHEAQAPLLRDLVEKRRWQVLHFDRLNFCGRFDRYNANRGRWPVEVVRVGKRSEYPRIRSYGDATHLGIFDQVDETPRLDAGALVQLWHYAYVRPARAYIERQRAMADLYGLPYDPRIERWAELGRIEWADMVPEAEFVPVPLPHPQVMTRWIAERREAVESGLV